MNRTFIGSVLFVDLVDYTRLTVPDQSTMKGRFIELLVDALRHVAVTERILVDTGDGAAVAFLGDPEDALFTALALRDAIDEGQVPHIGEPGFVRMGINLGPLKVVRDVNGNPNMIGDAVNDAQRVMSFASPGQVMVSHAYFDIISRLSHDYQKLFVYEGTRQDKHVREHEVYRLGATEDALTMTEKVRDRSRARQVPEPARVQRLRPRTSIAALIGILGLAGAGFWASAHSARKPIAPTLPAIERAVAVAPVSIPAPVPVVEPPAPAPVEKLASAPPPKRAKAVADAGAPPLKLGTVTLAVHPWGEVYVDGARRGLSPPIKSLNVAAGKHQITIRNGSLTPFVQSITVVSGSDTKVSYNF
ncbi:MAG: adenylate/guanylate cyclase domain-containing protein [Pseudomonadota bacterium]